MNTILSRPAPASAAAARRGPQAAYTLIEIMVAMLLLSVIVVGLIAMFGQTQNAFRVGMAQTDITEAGRSVMSQVARELSEAMPSRMSASNFIIYNPPVTRLVQDLSGSATTPPARNTFALQELLFLTRQNKQWNVISYRINDPGAGYGSLYRFETNLPPHRLDLAPGLVANTPLTSFSRVADGIIHFRIRPMDTNGWVIPTLSVVTNQQVFAYASQPPGEIDYYYRSNAVPHALGIEIGMLPPRLLQRLNALPDAATRRAYLSKDAQSGAVEMYQQRITLPNADPTAFP